MIILAGALNVFAKQHGKCFAKGSLNVIILSLRLWILKLAMKAIIIILQNIRQRVLKWV